jgi:hypothetical protein
MITQFVNITEPGDYVNPDGYPSFVGDHLTLTWHAGNARRFDVTAQCVIEAEEWREDGTQVLTLGSADPGPCGHGADALRVAAEWTPARFLAVDGEASFEPPVSEVLADLRDRLAKADVELRIMSHEAADDIRQRHLESKVQGVRLALSYLDEVTR